MAILRTIRICHFDYPNKQAVYSEQRLYRIALGSGYVIHCQSIRDTRQFIAETNRFLNQILDLLSGCLDDLFSEFSQYWRYFDRSGTIQFLKKIEDIFTSLQFALDRSHLTNGNHFVFRHLLAAADQIATLCEKLQKLNQPANAINKRLQAVEFCCYSAKEDLKGFPNQREIHLTKKIRSKIIIKPATM
jgi:hypothetical protein